MIKTSINLQDLRKRIYLKAKAEPEWRFWGMYVHICKMETLSEAYSICKANKGSPGADGVTFEEVEKSGLQGYLENLQEELITRTYRTGRNRKVKIPKRNGKFRILSIPNIKDRIVQCAVKLILEPIFEADFQPGSYGSRPERNAHEAVSNIVEGIIKKHTRVIDIDLKSYYDNIRHHILLEKLGRRIADDDVMHLLKLILKSCGKKGLGQGSPLSPLLANLYLNDVDKMLEKATSVTKTGEYKHVIYARYMDDLIVCVDNFRKWDWLYRGLKKRLYEEFCMLQIPINIEKSREIDVEGGESFEFLGFEIRTGITGRRKTGVLYSPAMNKRTGLLRKVKEVMRRFRSQPVTRAIEIINPIVRGWVNYFRIGTSSRSFQYIKDWLNKKVRRHIMRQRKRKGFGWNRWSNDFIYNKLKLFNDFKIVRYGEK